MNANAWSLFHARQEHLHTEKTQACYRKASSRLQTSKVDSTFGRRPPTQRHSDFYFVSPNTCLDDEKELQQTLIYPCQTSSVQRKGMKHCRRLTSVASLVHHQHIGANANYPTDITLELPVGQPDTASRGEGLGFGARLWAVHLGPRGIDHTQVFHALLLLLAIHVTGQPILLITASLNFNVTGWKRGRARGWGGHGLE